MTNLLARIEFLAQSLVRRTRACPYCRSERRSLVARKHGVVRLQRCSDCGLAYTDPTYRSFLPGDLYDRWYGAEGSTTAVPPPEELAALRAGAYAESDKYFAERLATLRVLAPGDRLLELGSSWGYFLDQARAVGFEPTGIEIGESRRRFGVEQLDLGIVRDFEDLGDARFDVVYSAHVLEHLTDLSSVFAAFAKRLVPGGLLALEVPNFDPEALGERALSIVGAVHPLGFDSAFFERNLPREGFEDVRIHSSWEDVPEHPVARAERDVVVCLARRSAP